MTAKRVNRRGAETRARILEAARGLLVQTGPESLTLRGVAARAELSLGNLQFHYPDLDAQRSRFGSRQSRGHRNRHDHLATGSRAVTGAP